MYDKIHYKLKKKEEKEKKIKKRNGKKINKIKCDIFFSLFDHIGFFKINYFICGCPGSL